MSKTTTASENSAPSSEQSWPWIETGALDPESWSVDDVSRFLEMNGFSQYTRLFRDDHVIDGRALLTLNEGDLRNDPLSIPVLGDIKRLTICIKRLQSVHVTQDSLPLCHCLNRRLQSVHVTQDSGLCHCLNRRLQSVHVTQDSGLCLNGTSASGLVSLPTTGLVDPVNPVCSSPPCGLHCQSSSLPTSIKRQPPPFPKSLRQTCKRDHEYDHDTDTGEYSDTSETDPEEGSKEAPSDRSDRSSRSTNGKSTSRNFTNYRSGTNGNSRNGRDRDRDRGIRQESWKALVAMFYFFCVTWITAFVMVIVHDRVPDMATYPPLPDIFLDNVPLIPWAFQMCELCGLILFIMWCKILVFHKYRFILLRRMFSLFGSVFLLRCVTMLITSLSVPGRHLECKARPYGSWTERLVQAYVIWQGGGMSLQGVRTCGDYMFSGHTVVLTLLNFFITEYTPASLYYVHTLSWVLNLFGIFFILAGHEHYSIDVFIAFYISTRLFLYYHTLANNRALYQPDRRRTKVWFPLFSFFESGVNGIVPNQFDCNISLRSLSNLILKFRHKIKYFKQKNSAENNNLLRNNQLVNDAVNVFHPKSN